MNSLKFAISLKLLILLECFRRPLLLLLALYMYFSTASAAACSGLRVFALQRLDGIGPLPTGAADATTTAGARAGARAWAVRARRWSHECHERRAGKHRRRSVASRPFAGLRAWSGVRGLRRRRRRPPQQCSEWGMALSV